MNRRIVLGLLFSGATAGAFAQEGRQQQDKLNLQETVVQSQNAAFLQQMQVDNLGESAISYTNEDGSFKHPLLANKSQYFGFKSSRFQDLKGWKLYGSFNLKAGKEKDVAYTTQLNPLRLNPYILVDSLQGDWNKQHYGFDVQVASPYFHDRVAVGLGLSYQVSTGARQRDPRPQNTQNLLNLKPAMAYKLDEHNIVGLYGQYNYFVEDLTVTNVNTNTVHNIYKLIGLGEYVGSSPLFLAAGGFARRYAGDTFGGGLTYSLNKGDFKGYVEGFYNHHKETATDGTTYPQNPGTHRYHAYGFNASLSQTQDYGIHSLRASWDQKDIANTEYHQYQDPITKVYETLFSGVFNTNLVTQSSLSYQFGKLNGKDLVWKAGVGAQYQGVDNRYATNLSQQTVDRLTYQADFTHYFMAKDQSGFVVQLGGAYADVLKTVFNYPEKSYATNFVAKEILYPTNAFLSTKFWQANAAVQYVFKPMQKTGSQLYIKASGSYLKPTTTNEYFAKKMSRTTAEIALGIYSF